MSKTEKLIEKIKNNPKNVRFETIQKLLMEAGFEERQPKGGSSHYTYTLGEYIIKEKNLSYYLNLKYPFTLQQDDDGSYLIEYNDLKGCISCGETLEEAIAMGEDAKNTWLEVAFEKGLDIPEPKSIDNYSGNLRLRMPRSLHKELSDEAEKEGISMNQYCIYLLSKGIGGNKMYK